MAKRERFTPDFKREAVRLWRLADKPASEIALDLGVRRKPALQMAGRHGQERRRGVSAGRVASLPIRNPKSHGSSAVGACTEERDILKKARRYFAKELK